MATPRSRARGSVGRGDQTLPDVHHPVGTLDADDELTFGDEDVDPRDPWSGEDDRHVPLGERLDIWRRKYLPLPDEVVYEFLGEDEYVVHSDHPSFRAFLTQNIALVILVPIVGPIFMWLLLREINLTTVSIFLLLDLIVAVLAFKRVSDRYTSYVITNLRLIKITGIVSRKLASIPWTRMTGLGYTQSAWGRIMGYATIFIESANEESGLRNFSDVNDPATFHQRLLDMVSDKSGQSSTHPPAPTRGERRGPLARRRERKRTGTRRTDVAPSGGTPGAPSPAPRRDEPGPSSGETWGRPKPAAQSSGAGRVRGRPPDPGLATGQPDDEPPESPDPPESPGPSGAPGGPGAGGGRPGHGPDAGRPGHGGEPGGAGQPAAGEAADPRSRTGTDAVPPGTPEEPGSEAEQAAVDPPAAEPDPPGRPRLGAWLRWPGTEPDQGGESPVTGPGGPRPPRPPRRPAQRAPSKSRPRTVVVPRSARQEDRSEGEHDADRPAGWRRRVREIEG